MENYIKIGKVKDAHGLHGDLYILVFSKDLSISKKLAHILLQIPTPMPDQSPEKMLTVVSIKPFKDGLKASFKEIQNRTEAESYRGAEVFVDAESFKSKPGEDIYLTEILHFALLDENQLKRGEVVGFSSNGPQDLLQIKNEKTEFMIPFVKELIREVSFDRKEIVMVVPEGIDEI